MSINGSSYQTNSLNIGGNMYIDNVVSNQNVTLNSSISNVNVNVSTISSVLINLAPYLNVPSTNPSSTTSYFGMSSFQYNGYYMSNLPGYSWSEPSYSGGNAFINCSELQNSGDIANFTNILNPINTVGVNIGAGYYDSSGNFGPVGSYGLAGRYSLGYFNPYTTLNLGGITTFPTAYSAICGVVIKYVLPSPSNFISLNISSIYPNSPTYVFLFGTTISYGGFNTWVQIGGPIACDFSTQSTNTLTLNNLNDYTAFAVVFPTIANPNGYLNLTSIQWLSDVDLVSFNSNSLIKYATNNLILGTNALGIYANKQTEIGNSANVLNLNKLALTYNAQPRHIITVNICGESTFLTPGLSYSFAFPETIRFTRPPMSFITNCDSSIVAFINVYQNGVSLLNTSMGGWFPVGGSNGKITNINSLNYDGGWLAMGGSFTINRGDIIKITVDHLTGSASTCTSTGLKFSFYES